MNTPSLYDLIKRKSKEKGRPLKIICDWDDCLQPVKPKAIYLESTLSIPFEKFFENFWEGTDMESASIEGKRVTNFSGSEEERKAIENFEKQREIRRKNPELYKDSFYVLQKGSKLRLPLLVKNYWFPFKKRA